MATFLTTEDKTRYARMCRILVDVTGKILRVELLKHISISDIPPKVITSSVPSVKAKYITFKSASDNAQIDGYGKFDISLIYTLSRTLCRMPKPTRGWDNTVHQTSSGANRPISPLSRRPFPCRNEQSLVDDIERIHLTWNDLYHSSTASLTSTDYEFYLNEIKDVCKRMDVLHSNQRNYLNDVEAIEKCSMDDNEMQVYIEQIGLAESMDTIKECVHDTERKTALQILLEETEYVIADQRSHGLIFVETNLYKQCKEKLSDSTILFISGNPGEGKTRYAVELLCCIADKGERLFVNDPRQLDSIDLSLVRGIVIDNIFGDVSYDERQWKSWEKKICYLKAISNQRKIPLFIFITSRTYLANHCTYKDLQLPEVQLLTDDLDLDSKLGMLEVYAKGVDADFIIRTFSSMIGFPQICYLFSAFEGVQDKGKTYFLKPDQYMLELLEQLQTNQQLDLFSLMMIVYQNGKININLLDEKKIQTLSESVGSIVDKHDIQLSLKRMTGSFVRFNDKSDVFVFSHDSLFDAVLKFSAMHYPISLIRVSDIRVLVNYVCVQGQSEAKDGMCVYINEMYAEKLSERYAEEFLENAYRKRDLIQSNALYSALVLTKFLSILHSKDKVESFLHTSDTDESLLVEYSYHGESSLSAILLRSVKLFLYEEWAEDQILTALKYSRRLGHSKITQLFEDEMRDDSDTFVLYTPTNTTAWTCDSEETVGNQNGNPENESETDDESDPDTSTILDFEKDIFEYDLRTACKERNYKVIDAMMNTKQALDIDFDDVALEMIRKGEDIDMLIQHINNFENCICVSLIHNNASAFTTLIEAISTENLDCSMISSYFMMSYLVKMLHNTTDEKKALIQSFYETLKLKIH